MNKEPATEYAILRGRPTMAWQIKRSDVAFIEAYVARDLTGRYRTTDSASGWVKVPKETAEAIARGEAYGLYWLF